MQPALAPAPPAAAMQNPSPENAAEQSLREHLLAQVAQANEPPAPAAPQPAVPVASASPHDQNIDPAIAGPIIEPVGASPSNGEEDGDESFDASGKKGNKRELSTSKRAAQNRAAQRAFRQRKEGYIKKLEEQVRDVKVLEENFKAIQAENYQLRDYIINLQSRLIESQGDFPQPPSNIDLSQPGAAGLPARPDLPPAAAASHAHASAVPTAPMGSASAAASLLQASAAQAQVVANMTNANKQLHEAPYHEGNGYPSKRVKAEAAKAAAAPAEAEPAKEEQPNGTS